MELALSQLTEWGNLVANRDTSEVATVEEFYRPRCGQDAPLPELARGPVQSVDLARPNIHAQPAAHDRSARHLGGTTQWRDAESRRDTWAGVGILCDELSAPVLTLNLRLTGESTLANILALQAAQGQPAFLTTRQLLQTRDGEAYKGGPVYVCENPVVIATAANQLGARSAPIVCVDGQPKTAARVLLNQIQKSGLEIYYHGDFDWPGLRIAHLIHQRHGAKPWRMNAEDYLAAPRGRRLEGEPFRAPWDDRLTCAMTKRGRAVFEEQVIDDLLSDLA